MQLPMNLQALLPHSYSEISSTVRPWPKTTKTRQPGNCFTYFGDPGKGHCIFRGQFVQGILRSLAWHSAETPPMRPRASCPKGQHASEQKTKQAPCLTIQTSFMQTDMNCLVLIFASIDASLLCAFETPRTWQNTLRPTRASPKLPTRASPRTANHSGTKNWDKLLGKGSLTTSAGILASW